MTPFTLTTANLRFRPLSTFFNILLLAAGIAMILTLGNLERAISQNLTRELKGIDLVVSAKGGTAEAARAAKFFAYTRHDRRTLRKLRILNALPVRWRGPLLAAYNRLAWAIARKGM